MKKAAVFIEPTNVDNGGVFELFIEQAHDGFSYSVVQRVERFINDARFPGNHHALALPDLNL